jgi:hypothetical protein
MIPQQASWQEAAGYSRSVRSFRAATVALLVLLAGCGEEPPSAGETLTIEEIAADPASFDGERVRIEAGYYAASEQSVLTPGFAESYPPMPMDPTIWVDGAPPEGCLQTAEDLQPDVSWAERVLAEGTFRYDPNGGFGHAGAWTMTLEGASLRCP